MKPSVPRATSVVGVEFHGDRTVRRWRIVAQENELPLRVFVRDAGTWRPPEGSELICVWDLEVIAAERRVYLDTIWADATIGAA